MNLNKQWKEICQIHLFTKHYLLLSEELSSEGDILLQPLKEHRDAYDHIIRVYSVENGLNFVDNKEEYIRGNMNKALGHEYRAFFDTADWLTMVCREHINKLLDGKTREEIEKVYPDYSEFRNRLIELPLRIASLRENKDIGKSKMSVMQEVEAYATILDELLSDYKKLYRALNN